MKLILITSVQAFQVQIQEILKTEGVYQYSYHKVKGHNSAQNVATSENWFVGDRYESESVLFYAFVQNDIIEQIFKSIEGFNQDLRSQSKIHISILNIEKSN
ncbi:MAG: hypothetical protein P1U56_03505 [Saprospiraceae bacterium]|nr:hypothetical protein [Saprospiraceae bacterium]